MTRLHLEREVSGSHIAAAAAILVVAAALRLYGLADWSLNNDEIAEVRWSSGSFSGMLDEVRRDAVHPPLDYIIQWFIGKSEAPEWARRLPSVIAGLLTVCGFMLLARWWHSPAAAVFAGLLLAVSPAHVRYSQEVRPYALGIFFIVAALVGLELFAATRRRPWAAMWFVSVFLAGATLYLAGVVVIVVTVTRVWIDRRRGLRRVWRRLPLAIGAWTVLYAPWLGVVVTAARSRSPAAPETHDWPWWEHRLHAFSTGPEAFQSMTVGAWIFWFAVAAGVSVSWHTPRLRTATSWLVLGSGLTIAILHLRPHFPNTPRYMMPAMIAGVLLAGAGIATWWRSRYARVAAVIAVAVMMFDTGATLGAYYTSGRPAWRDVARFVHDRVQPGDKVVLTNAWVTRNFGWYWEQMPPRDLAIEQFHLQPGAIRGPAWIVSAQCRPRAPLSEIELVRSDAKTELAQVRYLQAGATVWTSSELCPE